MRYQLFPSLFVTPETGYGIEQQVCCGEEKKQRNYSAAQINCAERTE